MAIESILSEIDVLHGVGARLVHLANDHLPLSKGLIGIAQSIRNTATLLAVLVATKVDGDELLLIE
jgi:hypothetical protein